MCFPNGSVTFSCGNMMPVHPPFVPSTSSPPFTLSASSATYRPGGVISGKCAAPFPSALTSGQSSKVMFRGAYYDLGLDLPHLSSIRYSKCPSLPPYSACLLAVTVKVLEDSSTEFQGFLLQARSREGNGKSPCHSIGHSCGRLGNLSLGFAAGVNICAT